MEFDFSDVKPSVFNWMVVGLLALTFIVMAKYVVNKWDNPATKVFKDFVNAA